MLVLKGIVKVRYKKTLYKACININKINRILMLSNKAIFVIVLVKTEIKNGPYKRVRLLD